MAYFRRQGPVTYEATELTGGAWREDEQHIAPALGLLVHAVELDRRRRRQDEYVVGRLAYDIFGTVPVDVVETEVQVIRRGRTIELVEARLTHGARTIVELRAWLMEPRDTSEIAGTPVPTLPAPGELTAWSPSEYWPGGFIGSVELRRHLEEPGRGWFWACTSVPLVEEEPVSATARAAGLFDIANGMVMRADPAKVHFPNIDLTAHLLREPQGDWLGFDTAVTFGDTGVGVTSTRLHDDRGPLGSIEQCVTIRPR